jgi:hypothetical protein
VLSALVTLHLALEDRPAAAAALKAATEWNLKNKVKGVGIVRMFLGLQGLDALVRGYGTGFGSFFPFLINVTERTEIR